MTIPVTMSRRMTANLGFIFILLQIFSKNRNFVSDQTNMTGELGRKRSKLNSLLSFYQFDPPPPPPQPVEENCGGDWKVPTDLVTAAKKETRNNSSLNPKNTFVFWRSRRSRAACNVSSPKPFWVSRTHICYLPMIKLGLMSIRRPSS